MKNHDITFWFSFRVICYLLVFLFLMALPVVGSSSDFVKTYLLGENNVGLWLVVIMYVPVCGLIELFFRKL